MAQEEPFRHKKLPRKLEDLDLIDDLLFQTMIMQESVGEEFCRILLRTILGKNIRKVQIVPQKNIPNIGTNRHGIRIDVYIANVSSKECMPGIRMSDIQIPNTDTSAFPGSEARITSDIYDTEPNNVAEKSTLPKRMRCYQSLIDTQLRAASASYSLSPNITTIVILPYDPFGKKQVVYTPKTKCVEGGPQKIFLYTKGTQNCPSQELKDMLTYIEKSTVDNVTNQDIETLHNLVQKVKKNREVGID